MAAEEPNLASKLDHELREYLAGLKPRKSNEAWPENKWEEEMEKHPFFMSKPPAEGSELPPLVEAIQQLKYSPENNTADELAMTYKDEGNQFFNLKKYDLAVASYNEALSTGCEDDNLNTILFTNRAAAHYHIGNIKKSLKDSLEAIKLNSDHKKAMYRAALCYCKLGEFDECISLCKSGLEMDIVQPKLQKSFFNLLKDAQTSQKNAERDKRKALFDATQEAKEREKVLKVIKERGINLYDDRKSNIPKWWPEDKRDVKSRVYIDTEECLIWPVMFLYPEYNVSDFIQHFHENSCFKDHLEEMFSPGNMPSWDEEKKYEIGKLHVYYGYENNLVSIDINESLKNILSAKNFVVYEGVPVFFITVANSKFDTYWKLNGLKKN